MSNDWLKQELTGRTLQLHDLADGEEIGRLRFTDEFNYGYNTLFRRYEARIGSVVRVLLDLEADLATAEVGGDELLSEPFDH